MHRTDADANIANAFVAGDPGIGQAATEIDAPWLNAVQEEICNTIEASGTVLSKPSHVQLKAALALLFDASGANPGGRLTLATGNPVTANDQLAANTLYYTPHLHNRIKIFDGARWKWYSFAELSLLTTDATKSPAAVAASSNYDVFVWDDGGTLRLSRGPAWTSDTARGTGAGTTELVRNDGRYVNAAAITHGPAQYCGIYVGTIRSSGSSLLDDSFQVRHVWNYYNRVRRAIRKQEPTANWNYTTATEREVNGGSNRVEIVRGWDEDSLNVQAIHTAQNSSAGVFVRTSIGVDVTNAFASGCVFAAIQNKIANYRETLVSSWTGMPGLGAHFIAWLEWSQAGTGTTTFNGGNETGLFGDLLA